MILHRLAKDWLLESGVKFSVGLEDGEKEQDCVGSGIRAKLEPVLGEIARFGDTRHGRHCLDRRATAQQCQCL